MIFFSHWHIPSLSNGQGSCVAESEMGCGMKYHTSTLTYRMGCGMQFQQTRLDMSSGVMTSAM